MSLLQMRKRWLGGVVTAASLLTWRFVVADEPTPAPAEMADGPTQGRGCY